MPCRSHLTEEKNEHTHGMEVELRGKPYPAQRQTLNSLPSHESRCIWPWQSGHRTQRASEGRSASSFLRLVSRRVSRGTSGAGSSASIAVGIGESESDVTSGSDDWEDITSAGGREDADAEEDGAEEELQAATDGLLKEPNGAFPSEKEPRCSSSQVRHRQSML